MKCLQCGVNEQPLNESVRPGFTDPVCRDCEIAMMSDPKRWPLGDRLPLKKRGSRDIGMLFITDKGALLFSDSLHPDVRTPTWAEAVYDENWRVD